MTAKFRKPHQQFVINEGARQKLVDLDTAPIRELLALFFSAQPDMDAVKHWAARNPDKWARSFQSLAQAAGLHYQPPTPPQNNVTVNLHLMSDSQVHALLAEQQQQLKSLGIQLPFLEAERVETVIDQKEAVNAGGV